MKTNRRNGANKIARTTTAINAENVGRLIGDVEKALGHDRILRSKQLGLIAIPATSSGDTMRSKVSKKVTATITSTQNNAVDVDRLLLKSGTSTLKAKAKPIGQRQRKVVADVHNEPRLIDEDGKVAEKRTLSPNTGNGSIVVHGANSAESVTSIIHNKLTATNTSNHSTAVDVDILSLKCGTNNLDSNEVVNSIGNNINIDSDPDISITMSQLLHLRKSNSSTPIKDIERKDLSNHGNQVNFVDTVADYCAETPQSELTCSSDEDVSSEDEDVSNDTPAAEEVKQTQSKQWHLECTYANKQELDEFFRREYWWSCRGSSDTNEGRKVLYRCNKVRRDSKVQCDAGLYVITRSIYATEEQSGETLSISYVVYRKTAMHNHDALDNLVVKVSDTVKQLIIDQFQNGRKPKKISYMLLDNPDITLDEKPSYKQVVKVVNAFKKSKYGNVPITMRQLCDFVKNHLTIPNGVDEPFIVQFEKSPRNVQHNKYFRFFISTRRLLSMASMATIVHSDATHKVTTEKLPLILIGVTDCNTNFHFTGLTIANHETADDYALTFHSLKYGVSLITGAHIQPKVLVCDADTAIHKGFKKVFGCVSAVNTVDDYDEAPSHEDEHGGTDCNGASNADSNTFLIIMCYFHVMLNIHKKYKFVDRKNKPLFKKDVRTLHICDSATKFQIGCELFVKKWSSLEPEATRLLKTSFFINNKNWYIGCAVRVPKSNNKLENLNGNLKRCQTEHQRQPLKQFLHTAISIVRQRSMEYLKDKVAYQTELNISDEIMEVGRNLKNNFVYEEKRNGAIDFYMYRSDLLQHITLDDVSLYRNAQYTSFDEFAVKGFDMWKITFPVQPDNWKSAVCTCPAFDLLFVCKHIIHIAYNIGIIKVADDDFDDQPLFVTGRGRPKKTTKALVRE